MIRTKLGQNHTDFLYSASGRIRLPTIRWYPVFGQNCYPVHPYLFIILYITQPMTSFDPDLIFELVDKLQIGSEIRINLILIVVKNCSTTTPSCSNVTIGVGTSRILVLIWLRVFLRNLECVKSIPGNLRKVRCGPFRLLPVA